MALKNHQPLDPAYLEKLQDYYAEHKVIPSYSVLATLWGISAKSWVSECVRRFEEAGYLDWTPDRQLKPGPRFFERRLAHDTVQAGLPNPALADGYDRQIRQVAGLDPGTLTTEEKLGWHRAWRARRLQDVVAAAYRRRGWSADGVPTMATLQRLGLTDAELLALAAGGSQE